MVGCGWLSLDGWGGWLGVDCWRGWLAGMEGVVGRGTGDGGLGGGGLGGVFDFRRRGPLFLMFQPMEWRYWASRRIFSRWIEVSNSSFEKTNPFGSERSLAAS